MQRGYKSAGKSGPTGGPYSRVDLDRGGGAFFASGFGPGGPILRGANPLGHRGPLSYLEHCCHVRSIIPQLVF